MKYRNTIIVIWELINASQTEVNEECGTVIIDHDNVTEKKTIHEGYLLP